MLAASALELLYVFGQFPGLRINYANCFALLKRQEEEVPPWHQGFVVKEQVRYLHGGHDWTCQGKMPIMRLRWRAKEFSMCHMPKKMGAGISLCGCR